MSDPSTDYVRYTDDVETLLPDEEAVITETIETMRHTMTQTFEKQRHATSGTHAKTHGVVTGTLTVVADLAPELAQGLFAEPGTYEAVLRYASEPGAVDPDTAPRARGAALKIMGVTGEKLRPQWDSQDFLFNTWPVIPQGDAATYLAVIKQRDEHFDQTNRVRLGSMLHHPSPKEGLFDSTPNISPVAHQYYTQGAFRYGDHLAKLALVPATEAQRQAGETTVSSDDPPGVLRDWTRDFHASHAARFELQVQLCTDLKKMPVEDASKEWKTKLSPYRTVATLDIPIQESFSPARRVYAEDVMSWRPWSGLVAHRPLGSINRVRRRAYEELGAYRHEVNARTEENPTRLADVPD